MAPEDGDVPSQDELRQRLTPLQFDVTQKGATEYGGTGGYYRHDEDGTYRCICCHAPLFHSSAKYHSGSGWPSYFEPIEGAVATTTDRSHGMVRTEARCTRCNAHLGHVFDDGPQPTGTRYCINSASLDFEPEGPGRDA